MRLFAIFCIAVFFSQSHAQDTFSIVAVDSATGEVGSAGASCLDDNIITGGVSIIKDVVPGVGAINTQASYNATNQTEASIKLSQGWSATDIINWLVNNDAQNDSTRRQYGIARFDTSGGISTAAFTGSNCFDEKHHIVGPYYTIQGNILLGKYVLDSMEQRFLNSSGPLAGRLMQALQGANIPGADSRCLNEGVSSQSAYLTVASPNDPAGSPYLDLVVSQTAYGVEPIDSLNQLFENWRLTSNERNSTASSYFKASRRNKSIFFQGLSNNAQLSIYSLDGKLLTKGPLSNGGIEDPAADRILILKIEQDSEVFIRRLAP